MPLVHFFFAYNQHIRYFHQFGIPYLLAYFFAAVIYFGPYIGIFQRCCHFVSIFAEFIADRQHFHLLQVPARKAGYLRSAPSTRQ